MADTAYPDDTQLAGLIQAATAMEDEHNRDTKTLGKRKRDEAFLEQGLTLPPLDGDGLGDVPDISAETNLPQLQNSASVLFREPSSKSKKHSRPPLGKVFSSLELAPENFLRMQNAAKAFMLDEAHPERRDVVGHKKNSGGADLAKLNLWNCVDEFLSTHGFGEKFFAPGAGSDVPGAPQRTLLWPGDGQIIIKLMMPLMRKMVTNERQRIYAAATRKQGTAKETSEEQSPNMIDDSIMSAGNTLESNYTEQAGEGEIPHVASAQQDVANAFATVPAQQGISGQVGQQATATFKQSIVLYVNVVSNTAGALRRVIPRFSLTPDATPNLSALLSEVNKRYPLPSRNGSASGDQIRPVVKVWLTDGLVSVVEDGDWMVALLSAGFVDWMDAEVRILVEV